MLKKSRILVMVLIMVFVISSMSMAAYPEKPIKMLMGFSPGGGSDALAQLVEPFLQDILDTSFVNEYKPGATGAIAWTQLAYDTDNDGYTISVTNTPMLMTNYIMNEEIVYHIDMLDPIANIVTDPGVMVVPADSPFDTMEEFMTYAEENPGEVTVGHSGVGGDDFFSMLILERETGLDFQLIPFTGDGPSWQAAMGGKIDASSNNVGITYPQVKEGNLKALAVYSEERIDALPDVPTMKELGYNVVAGSSRGISGPEGMPEEAVDTLIAAVEEMAKDPEFQKAAADRAMNLDIKTGEEYWNYLETQSEIYGEIWENVKDQYQN